MGFLRPVHQRRRPLILLFALTLAVWPLAGATAGPRPEIAPGLSAGDWQAIRAQMPVAPQTAPQTYLKASNPDAEDSFGTAVAISGDTLVVGAPYEDSAGSNPADNSADYAGAVYVFVRAKGRGEPAWIQQAYLKASNAGAGDWFGVTVAIDGDTIVVGAPWEDSAGGNPADNSAESAGAAYVFVRSRGVWTQQAYLKAANPSQLGFFGYNVAISGDTLIAENYAADSVEVFVRSKPKGGPTWTRQAALKGAGVAPGDTFGSDLAISGDTVVVGASGDSSASANPGDTSAPLAGAAYVFARSRGAWSQQAYLKAANAESFDQFGRAVAIDGDTIVIGADLEDGNGGSPADNSAESAGAAYVFARTRGAWSQQAYLKAANAEAGDQFGLQLAISGDTVVVGSLWEDSAGGNPADNSTAQAGAAYVFARKQRCWTQQAYLKAANADVEDSFGIVAISGASVVAGAPSEDSAGSGPADNSAGNAGAAYVFEIRARPTSCR